MTSAIADRLSKMDKGELAKLTNALDAMDKGGEAVLNPGKDIGMAGSAVRKSFGPDAFSPGSGNRQDNFSYWEAWSDPSTKMNQDVRAQMLQKSLFDMGYKDARAFKSHGHFIRSGFTTNRAEFQQQHKGYFAGVDANFLKARGITTVSGEAGGYLLMPEFAPKIEQLFFANDLASRIDNLPISGSLMHMPRARDTNRADGTRNGGAVGQWLDVGQSITESNFKFGMTRLEMKKLAIVVFFPPELMTDSEYAIEEYIRRSVREEISWQIGRSILWGQDGPEPLGFLRSPVTISVAKESGQTNYTVVTENIVKMQARLFSNPGSKPCWLAHKSVGPQLAQLEVNNFPVAININNGGISSAPQLMLRGMEIIESEFCAQLGSLGDIVGADLKGYKGITRSLVREDVSMHYEFLADLTALRIIVGFDGRPLYNESIQPFQAPNSDTPDTCSWFVNLATRKP